jgi:hypothetical protein
MSDFQRTLFAAMALSFAAPAFAACDWAAAKKDIELVLDQDKARGEAFRAVVKTGKDSLDALEALADPAAKERIKACGYQAAELLSQRGFPPLH